MLKRCSACRVEKDLSDFGRHARRPDGLRDRCRECESAAGRATYLKNAKQQKDKSRAWYATNRERLTAELKEFRKTTPARKGGPKRLSPEERAARKTASRKATYEKNKAKVLATAARYRAANKEKDRNDRKAHYAANRDHVLAQADKYRRANLPLYASAAARRKARKLRATPAWVNMIAIDLIYEWVALVSAETGVPHEVDHEIPLYSKIVCGLHVETNLQILPRSANRSKGNRFVW